MLNNLVGRWLLVALLVHHGVHAVPKPKDGAGVEGIASQVVAPLDKAAKEQARQKKLEDMRAEAYDPRSEEVVNLCIFNDYSEICPPWATLDVVMRLASEQGGAMVMDTLHALLGQQTVLCTKSLWVTIQNLVRIWETYADETISEREILYDYKVNVEPKENFVREEALESIRASKSIIVKFNKFYQQEVRHKVDALKQHKGGFLGSSPLQSVVVDIFNDINNLLQDRFEQRELHVYGPFFYIYMMYQIILRYDYYESRCLDGNYIIFFDIVNRFVANIFDSFGSGYFVGNNYSAKKYLSRQAIDETHRNSKNITTEDVGYQLKKLIYHITENLDERVGVNILQQPYFNIFLGGHGLLNHNVAGLSVLPKNIKKQSSVEVELLTSDFAWFLQFLNNRMRIKTLTILSCYAAGQKYEGTPLTMQQQFNNSVLENIKYPILFIGSFAAVTFSFGLLIDDMFRFNKYFSLLNEHPIQYKKAAESFYAYKDSFQKHNLASIKMPNTSWLTLVSSINDTVVKKGNDQVHSLVITQNKVLDGKVVRIPWVPNQKPVDVIWLQANYIPKIVMSGYDSKQFNKQQYFDKISKNYSVFPSFLPVQRYNQNYVIDVIECKDLEITEDGPDKVTFKDVMQHFFDVQGIQEPVNIVIKNFVFKNVTYKNVYVFMYNDFASDLFNIEDGYVYTGSDGQTYIVSWVNDHKNHSGIPETVTKKVFDPHVLQRKIAEVEKAAKADLKSVIQIEKAVIQKQITNVNPKIIPVPVKVQKSRDTYAQMTQEAKDQMVYSVSKKIQTA